MDFFPVFKRQDFLHFQIDIFAISSFVIIEEISFSYLLLEYESYCHQKMKGHIHIILNRK